jgi:hypothetical protein
MAMAGRISLDEVTGGSPHGASTIIVDDGGTGEFDLILYNRGISAASKTPSISLGSYRIEISW